MVVVGCWLEGGGIITSNTTLSSNSFFPNTHHHTRLRRRHSLVSRSTCTTNNIKLLLINAVTASASNSISKKRGRGGRGNRLNFHSSKGDGLLYVEVDPFGADSWKLDPVVELLKQGAVGVIPTDTVYAFVCDMKNNSAIERLRRIKSIETSKPLSVLCRTFRDIDTLTTGFPRGDGQGRPNIFRAVKHCLPGPYTFILTASKELPKQCTRYGATSSKFAHRKSVGVRIPDDDICLVILEKMGAPLISTSVRCSKENQWILDPVVIADLYGPEGLDFVVAAGVRVADPSTVVDMLGSYPKVIRQGKGPKQPWMAADEDEEELAPYAA